MPTDELTTEIEQAVNELDQAEASVQEEEAVAEITEGETVAVGEVAAEHAAVKDKGEGYPITEAAPAVGTEEESIEGVAADEEAASEAAATVAAEAAGETTPPLSEEVLARAVSVGIPVTDAQALTSASLERIISAREAADAAVAREQVRADESVSEEVVDPFSELPKLDPEVHEPQVVEAFEKLTDIVKQQRETIQDFYTRQEETALAAQGAAGKEVEKWFDGQISGLGENFSEALGSSGYSSLDRGSSQFAKREAIANQMNVLLSGYRASEQQAPLREEVFDMAARLVLREEYQQIHEKKLTGDLAKRSSQHIQRVGGQRANATQTPDEEIAAELDAKFGN